MSNQAGRADAAGGVVARRLADGIAVRVPFVQIPCLRCGELSVLVPFLFPSVGRDTLACRRCEALHYLRVTRTGHRFDVRYHRYTLRYPLEFYDEGEDPPVVQLSLRTEPDGELECFAGPVVIHPRKARFTSSEVEGIWRATNGVCHICKRRWRIKQRGKNGWHIDHVIPHIGGGADVEHLPNLRVACAKCNLRKGRGYTQAQVRFSLRRLVEQFDEWPLLQDVNRIGEVRT